MPFVFPKAILPQCIFLQNTLKVDMDTVPFWNHSREMQKLYCCFELLSRCSDYQQTLCWKKCETSPRKIMRGEYDKHSVLAGWRCSTAFFLFSAPLKDFVCSMSSSPSAIIHCCASGQVQTAETQVSPHCSGSLLDNNQNCRNLIKSLECQVKVNRNYMAAYCYVTLFIFLRSLSDLKTNGYSN